MTADELIGATGTPIEDADDIDESLASEQESGQLSADDLSNLVTYTLDWSVQSLLERIGRTFDINPSFQRRDAWNMQRKSLYIESLLLGLPVPPIVLAEDPKAKGKFIVIDGKQRLVTMKQFADPNEHFPEFRLRGLEYLRDLNKCTFRDIEGSLFDSDYAEGLLSQPIRTIVIRNWTSQEVLYNIFVRLNQGSTPLSPQELRQALYPNDFTKWVNARSSKSGPIHRARRIKSEDFRMRDAEMLLRFIAFQESLENYAGNLRQFLDEACGVGQSRLEEHGEPYLEDLAHASERAVNRTFDIFSGNAFLRYQSGQYNRRFNIAVFDLMTAIFASPEITDEMVRHHSEKIESAYKVLCEENADFLDSLRTSTKTIRATAGRIIWFGSEVERILDRKLGIVKRAEKLMQKVK